MAKVNPVQFLNQVKVETAKVVWPSWPQTLRTGLMVVLMATILGVFFFAVDSAFGSLVQGLLKLLG